jgi:hypothetical protein
MGDASDPILEMHTFVPRTLASLSTTATSAEPFSRKMLAIDRRAMTQVNGAPTHVGSSRGLKVGLDPTYSMCESQGGDAVMGLQPGYMPVVGWWWAGEVESRWGSISSPASRQRRCCRDSAR